jgi:Cu/Ag efflux pump CusA
VGIKVMGADLAVVERLAMEIEAAVSRLPGTRSAYAERVAGGYFLDFVLKRDELARYGLSIDDANMMVMTAVGGDNQSITVEGRERYGINVRYARDYREDLQALRRVLLPLLRPAVIAALVYSFISAMTSISAVIFLTSPRFDMATVNIVGRAEVGEYGYATAYASVLIVLMVAAVALIRALVGKRRVGGRDATVAAS